MDDMKWMIAEQTLEEELVTERQCRAVQDTRKLEDLKVLCVALIRQNGHQRKLLSQAVGKIAEMDAQLACFE